MAYLTWDQQQKRLNDLATCYSVLARQREVFAALKEIEENVTPANNDVEQWEALVGLVASEILDNVKLIWELSDWGRPNRAPKPPDAAT